MELTEQVGKLKKVIEEKGLRLGEVENEIGVSKNNLSGILKGKKELPKKCIATVASFLENHSRVMEDWEEQLMKIFEENDTPENRKLMFDSIFEAGVLMTETTDDFKIRVIPPYSQEYWEALDKMKALQQVSDKGGKVFPKSDEDIKMDATKKNEKENEKKDHSENKDTPVYPTKFPDLLSMAKKGVEDKEVFIQWVKGRGLPLNQQDLIIKKIV